MITQGASERATPPGDPSHVLLVFLTTMSCMILELILSRVAGFHLGESYAYLAIPITFLGLALGSIHVHLSRRVIERFDSARATLTLLVVTLIAIGVTFTLFGALFPVYSEYRVTDEMTRPLLKALTFVGVNAVPFYVIGRILAVVYFLNRERIGTIYSADLWGASLACCLTPLLFHFFDLPEVVLAVVLVLSVLGVLFLRSASASRKVAAAVVLAAVCVGFRFLVAWAEDTLDVNAFGDPERERVVQVAHRWNEFSRVVLLRFDRGRRSSYLVLHDNGRSYVHVSRFRPDRVRRDEPLSTFNAPWVMGRATDDILVMFAGSGTEMNRFNELSEGRSSITGVEINPAVRDLVTRAPELASYRLREFYDRPNVDLVIQEGRHFLADGTDLFDVIFQGSDAALGGNLTAHSRKYLDTVEAYVLYLRRLRPGGVLAFNHKPIEQRLPTLRAALREAGGREFAESVIVLDDPERGDDLLFSPSGFSEEEVQRLASKAREKGAFRIRYAPGYARNQRGYVDMIASTAVGTTELLTESRVGRSKLLTDDSPFIRGLDLELFQWNPVGSRQLFICWVKVMTLLVIAAVALLLLVGVQLPRRTRLPPAVLGFLVVTGFCYMLREIALMAKLELFLQIPIVSMATVLSVFLVAGGVGSRLAQRFAARLDLRLFPFLVAAVVLGSIVAVDQLNTHLIGLSTAVKVIIAGLTVSPVGLCLGAFYPYAVTCLVGNGRESAVPITYGVSTISSVVGATYAITFMVETGFSQLLEQAAAGYAGLGLLVVAYIHALKGRQLSVARPG